MAFDNDNDIVAITTASARSIEMAIAGTVVMDDDEDAILPYTKP